MPYRHKYSPSRVDKMMQNMPIWHTSRFNIDEDALKVGMGLMAYLTIKN